MTTKDQLIDDMASVMAGLQVPLSLGMHFGTADEPYRRILNETGFGWRDADDFRTALTEILCL